MRTPIFKITNDDDPLDYAYPVVVTLDGIVDDDGFEPSVRALCGPLAVGQSVTVGGGAAGQFTIERIR